MFNADWYNSLAKSPLNPPDWVFGPAWTILYILMAIALIMVIRRAAKVPDLKPAVRRAVGIFALQLILNLIWSPLFFSLKHPDLAMIDIVLLLPTIIWTIIAFRKISKTASYLLIPYAAWVTFATYLNLSILLLN